MEQSEQMEQLRDLSQTLKRMKPALTISRCPEKTVEKFKQLAKEGFCDDYGMFLKHLMDTAYPESLQTALAIQKIIENLTEIETRLANLENTEEPTGEMKRMCDGTLRRVM
jgi:hypothetical protein